MLDKTETPVPVTARSVQAEPPTPKGIASTNALTARSVLHRRCMRDLRARFGPPTIAVREVSGVERERGEPRAALVARARRGVEAPTASNGRRLGRSITRRPPAGSGAREGS